jgi:hypothetical protein
MIMTEKTGKVKHYPPDSDIETTEAQRKIKKSPDAP